MTITKKSVSFLLTLIMMFGVLCRFSTPASAASIDGKYPKQSVTGYILASNNKTAIAYSSKSCSDSSRIGYIYAGDNCTIQEIYSDGVVKVKCPWTGYKNDRVVYSMLSYFFQNTSVSVKTATAKTKCYNKSDLKTSPGYVYAKDKCYIVGTSGNYYQALVPWNTGGYKLCWVNKSAFSNTQNNNTSGTNSSSSASFSVSNNVVTLNGVSLYEYPIGNKVPISSNKFKVNGKDVDMKATQCYGFACYVQTKLCGGCWHTARGLQCLENVPGSKNVKPNDSKQLKSLIEDAGTGAHIRVKRKSGKEHSLIIASINSNGFTIIDANTDGNGTVRQHTYTWNEFLSEFPTVLFIERYKN